MFGTEQRYEFKAWSRAKQIDGRFEVTVYTGWVGNEPDAFAFEQSETVAREVFVAETNLSGERASRESKGKGQQEARGAIHEESLARKAGKAK
jgi:hypothetical protein